MIKTSVFVLVETRKRRESNPRVVAHRSLSRSSTPGSAVTAPGVWAGRRPGRGHSQALLIAGECNHKCNHCGCAHWDVRRPSMPRSEQDVCPTGLDHYVHVFY